MKIANKISLWEKIISRQYVPKKEEIESNEIIDLTRRLKANSPAKTLTNVLEWQDRNIKYWAERGKIPCIILILIGLSVLFFGLYSHNNIGSTLVAAVFFLLIFLFLLDRFDILSFSIYLIFLFSMLLLLIVGIAFLNPKTNFSSNFLFFSLGISLLLGAFISIIAVLVWDYRDIKRVNPKFDVRDLFKTSLPIKKILDYRLSICKDYAKLTCAFLLNIYPQNEIYFIQIPYHVAVGIKIGKKIYVLDQKLPVTDLSTWLTIWKKRFKKKRLGEKFLRVILEENKLVIEKTELEYLTISPDKKVTDQDIKIFVDKLKKKLNIPKLEARTQLNAIEFEIPLNFNLLTHKDEIIENSFLEFAKNKIEDECAGNVDKICDISPSYENNSLIIKMVCENATT